MEASRIEKPSRILISSRIPVPYISPYMREEHIECHHWLSATEPLVEYFTPPICLRSMSHRILAYELGEFKRSAKIESGPEGGP